MIYFLTVNYYSISFVRKLIRSIEKAISVKYQVLVVNNSPEETDIYELSSNCIRIIDSGDNIGFGRACNLGIRHVWQENRDALIWLINPDATLESGADNYVYQCLKENPSIGILGTKIKSTDGRIWFSAGKFNPWTGYIRHSTIDHNDTASAAAALPTDWVSGCSLIINLSRFSQCPAFDPSYFLYFEDVDLCRRYLNQGYIIAVTRKVLVTHQVSAIIGSRVEFMFRKYTFGRLLFLWKHATRIGFMIYFFYLILRIFSLLAKGKKGRESAKGRSLAVVDFIHVANKGAKFQA